MKIMLNIGDSAYHRSTGNMGKVVAYGHQIVDGVYLPTLKVEVQVVNKSGKKKRIFIEDVFQEWMQVEPGDYPEKPTERDFALAEPVPTERIASH